MCKGCKTGRRRIVRRRRHRKYRKVTKTATTAAAAEAPAPAAAVVPEIGDTPVGKTGRGGGRITYRRKFRRRRTVKK